MKQNNIVQLIQNAEVEWKKLWEVTIWDKKFNAVESHKQPHTIKYHYLLSNEIKSLILKNGNVKLLSTNETDWWTSEELAGNKISDAEIVAIPWGGNPIVQYYNGKFLTGDNRIAVSIDNRYLNTKYLYYFLKNNILLISSFYRGSGIKHPSMSNVLDMDIPIPPLSIQQEIVKTLDKLTELEAKLEAELALREKQYNYYRDQLLTFGDDVEWKMLGEVIQSLKTGLNPRKNFTLNTVDADCYYVTVREIQNGNIVFSDKTDRVNNNALKLINNRSTLEVGDILFSGTGTVGRTAVIEKDPTNWNIKEGVYVIKPIHNIIDSKYLYYLLSSEDIIKEYSKKIVGSPVISLPMKELKNLQIPIPPLSTQEKIVDILDKFDTLTKSITEGLPKEIELRRKQYEYYRELLLNFPKF